MNLFNCPDSVIIFCVLQHISYFDLDDILLSSGLPPKLAAQIKLQVYLRRLTCEVEDLGDGLTVTRYTVEGLLHREGDLPALVYSNGGKTYMKKNVIHRDVGPAVWTYNKLTDEFTIIYMRHGVRHNDGDSPSIITSKGTMIWFKYGKQTRGNDLPSARYANGDLHWTQNDKLHRLKKPAIITIKGDMYYYEYGIPVHQELWKIGHVPY